MEKLIQEEVDPFKRFISKHSSELFDIIHKLNLLNALWKVNVVEGFDNPRLLGGWEDLQA